MKPTGCIRCGAAGNHDLYPLELVACAECYLLWIRDESCSVDAVTAVVGHFRSPAAAHWRAFDAELLKRTESWAKTARAT